MTGNMVCVARCSTDTREHAASVMGRFTRCALDGMRPNVMQLDAAQFNSNEPVVYAPEAFAEAMKQAEAVENLSAHLSAQGGW